MEHDLPTTVLHWNYRGFTEFPIEKLNGDEADITDIYLKENLISHIPSDIGKLIHLESLYLSGNDITVLPKEIYMLKYLKCLDVSGNRLKEVPEEIGEVRSLKFLILDENELIELPLRIADLRSLRYLSVCDNKLRWLPQRPVYNYHHCEFRFWRNASLKTIPYSLWHHMFRCQQTRSLNIGCLSIPRHQHVQGSRYRLKLVQESGEWDLDVECPPQYTTVLGNHLSSPPSLLEICRRNIYQTLSDAAKRLSTEMFSIYSEHKYCNDNNNISNLDNQFQEINIDNSDILNCDYNGNNLQNFEKYLNNIVRKRRYKSYYVPADLVQEHLDFLPRVIKNDLSGGPVSTCENVSCKKPVFDFAIYEFCLGKIILIDKAEEVILSAVFCSKSCAYNWKRGKTNLIPWTLLVMR